MSAPAIDQIVSRPVSVTGRPRRVCLVTEAAGGGAGRHFLDLAEGLVARGVNVVAIFSPTRSDASFRERRSSIGGVQFVDLPMRRAVHPLDALDLSRLISRIRNEGPFDLVHGHSSKGGALARLAARRLGIPSVYTPHAFATLDPTLPFWKRRFYGQIERWLARQSSAIIAVSTDEALHARELGIEATKIHVVHNGIDSVEFPPREVVRSRLGLSPHDFVIGFVGRLVSQKGPELLIEALGRLSPHHDHAKVVMIGDGPTGPALRRRIGQLGLAPRVHMLGDVVATFLMPAFDVFCLPSRYEGMPYVLLEALAAGLPIVAARVGGVANCVDEGDNGLIVASDNVSELAAVLDRLASDTPLRERYAEASARKATQFSASRMVDETLAVYQHAVGQVFNLPQFLAG
jgi:glycosyltransferase involved in cell wall biosynthesis